LSQPLSFPLKAGLTLTVLSKNLRKDLEGNVSVQSRIVGAVDFSHSPFADLLDNPVMANCRTDHANTPWMLIEVPSHVKGRLREKATDLEAVSGVEPRRDLSRRFCQVDRAGTKIALRSPFSAGRGHLSPGIERLVSKYPMVRGSHEMTTVAEQILYRGVDGHKSLRLLE
jgi:hypothetical protein